MIMKDTNPKPF